MSVFTLNSPIFSVSRAVFLALVGTSLLSIPAFAVDELRDEETPYILSLLNDEEAGCGLPLEWIDEIDDIEFELTGTLPEFEEVSVASLSSHSPWRTGSTSPSEATSPATEKKRASFTWTKAEDEALIEAVHCFGEKEWKRIAEQVGTKLGTKFSNTRCRQRWRHVLRPGLVSGNWTKGEDASLLAAVEATGLEISEITKFAGLRYAVPGRTPKQIRERLKCCLDPSIERGPFTKDEDEWILRLHGEFETKWVHITKVLNSIARFDEAGNALKNRTENNVKNRFKSLVSGEAREARRTAKALMQEQTFSRVTSPATAKKRRSSTWTEAEDEVLIEAVRYFEEKEWEKIAARVGTKFSDIQCQRRWWNVLHPCHVAGRWTKEEDASLLAAVEATGLEISEIRDFAGLIHAVPGRTPRQIGERLKLALDPRIEQHPFTEYEDQEILRLYGEFGNKWVKITKVLNSIARFDDAGNALKNRTQLNVKYRLKFLVPGEAKEARNAAKALMQEEQSTSK